MPVPRENPDPLLAPRRLDEMLLYRLSVITRGSSLPMVRIFEGGLGITRRHWHVLALVVEHGGLSPSQVSDLCWLDRPQASRALSGLIEQKLVQRFAGPARTCRMQATAAGIQMYERALAQVTHFNAELIGVLSAEERLQLDSLLARLQGRVQTLADDVARAAPPARRSLGGRPGTRKPLTPPRR